MEDFLINNDERISNEELQDAFINKLNSYHLDDFDKTKDTLIVYY